MKEAYSNLIIYYFSGTGNARCCAEWIAGVASEKNIHSELVNIDRFKEIKVPKTEGKTLIGFCYPTHGFNAPPIMLEFMYKFPKLKNTDVFFMNTRGGLKFVNIYTPGLSGVAQWLPVIIFLLKGFGIRAFRPADLPSNWIPLHPGIRKKNTEKIVNYWEPIVKRFAEKMLTGKIVFRPYIGLIADILIAPASLGYYCLARFLLAKTFISTRDCNMCGLCIKICPTVAIKTVNGRPFWTRKCESCMRCLNHCPKRAIETPHSFVALLIFATITVNSVLCNLLIKRGFISGDESDWYSWINLTLWFIIGIPVFYFGYRLLHEMMRVNFLDRVITYTSLTKFGFWRRYKFPRKKVS